MLFYRWVCWFLLPSSVTLAPWSPTWTLPELTFRLALMPSNSTWVSERSVSLICDFYQNDPLIVFASEIIFFFHKSNWKIPFKLLQLVHNCCCQPCCGPHKPSLPFMLYQTDSVSDLLFCCCYSHLFVFAFFLMTKMSLTYQKTNTVSMHPMISTPVM